MMRAAMPKLTSAVTGLAGFAAAHQVMSMIDPEHSIPELPALLTEGTLAGGIGTGILKMLGSSTYFAPEIIGGAVGYYVGAKTSQAWSNWMRELGTSEQFAVEAVRSLEGRLEEPVELWLVWRHHLHFLGLHWAEVAHGPESRRAF